MDKINILASWIKNSHNIVFFGGAGISTESGIPDFRSQEGLYHLDYDYPPEKILSHSFFYKHPEAFFQFYTQKMLYIDAMPSFSHHFLTTLEKAGKLKAIITQNIDRLHQKADSKNVLELHGNVFENNCCLCNQPYSTDSILNLKGLPYCKCGGLIKPHVILYDEVLDQKIIMKSIEAISNADVLIVGGTSLSVYPAASFIDYYKGNKLILINLEKTSKDHLADLVIYEKIGDVFKQVDILLNSPN